MDSPDKPHGGLQTTTNQPEAAPEILLTRGYSKRSLAAMEPEFVDSNTLDAHAPSSSVLQSDYLIIDDMDRLGEHLDMAGEVPTPCSSGSQASPAAGGANLSLMTSTGSSESAAAAHAHAAKRVRYSFPDDGQPRPTAADLSILQPVIQPDNRRELGGQQHGHHHHHQNNTPQSNYNNNSNIITHKPVSRARSVADLLPSSTDVAPIDMDEDASEALGDPVDSSNGMLAMEVEPSEEELIHMRSHGPVSGRVSSAAAFLEPKKRVATDSIFTPHTTAAEGTSSSTTNNTTVHSSSFQTTPSPEHKRSLSISSSSIGTPGHAHNSHNSHLSDKKGLKREVKIQLLDDMESKPILEEARRASIDQLREAREDKKHPPTSSSSTRTTKPSDKIEEENEDEDVGEEKDTVLPKEDPTIHDWDQEELEDDENYDYDDVDSTPSPAGSLTSGNIPREETISSLQKRQRQFERDRRRAAFLSSQPTSDNDNDEDDDENNSSHSLRSSVPYNSSNSYRRNSDIEEDKDDPFLDPERDSAFMSEAQEADTHNVHLRLENQREFQDAAGLDLGEGEAAENVVNEDGQYGGMIEADDEGDDFWENR
ncbi:hypothetical protein BGX24_006840 [Mortierella sp. AD032]|nr:hypothetical protein BGX24_006840 [Mortierella sp. AD032]